MFDDGEEAASAVVAVAVAASAIAVAAVAAADRRGRVKRQRSGNVARNQQEGRERWRILDDDLRVV